MTYTAIIRDRQTNTIYCAMEMNRERVTKRDYDNIMTELLFTSDYFAEHSDFFAADIYRDMNTEKACRCKSEPDIVIEAVKIFASEHIHTTVFVNAQLVRMISKSKGE